MSEDGVRTFWDTALCVMTVTVGYRYSLSELGVLQRSTGNFHLRQHDWRLQQSWQVVRMLAGVHRVAQHPCVARFNDLTSPSRSRWQLWRPEICYLAAFRWTSFRNSRSKARFAPVLCVLSWFTSLEPKGTAFKGCECCQLVKLTQLVCGDGRLICINGLYNIY